MYCIFASEDTINSHILQKTILNTNAEFGSRGSKKTEFTMKKIIMFGVASVIALAFSVTSFAGSKAEKNHHDGVCVEMTSQGRGPCTHSGCKCTGFNQRPGYYQCWCGHQSFVHK